VLLNYSDSPNAHTNIGERKTHENPHTDVYVQTDYTPMHFWLFTGVKPHPVLP